MQLIPVRLHRKHSAPAISAFDARLCTFAMYTAGFLAVVNVSIMYLALDQLEAHLGAGLADQQWILSIYPLMEGGFALALGVLGDAYGCKRVLAASTWMFLLATVASAFAPNAGALIVGRGLQGIASAAFLSLPLAILIDLQPDRSNNLRIVQTFATVTGLAAGFAPLIGGALVSFLGWQAVFYFSALLAVIVLAGLRAAPDNATPTNIRLDLGGQVTSILACFAISYALIEGNTRGFGSPAILSWFCIAFVSLALFLILERRVQHPMIDLRYFRLKPFDASLLAVGIVNFAWYGLMLLCTLFMEHVAHLRGLIVGLYLMPCNAGYFIANIFSAQIERKIGMHGTVVLSFIVTFGGMAWMMMLHPQSAAWEAGAALGIAGVGWGIISTPVTSMAMSAVRGTDEGFASGTLALTRSLFGVFGIAVLGSIIDGGMVAHLPGFRTTVQHGNIFEIQSVSATVQHAFVQAMRVAVGACFALTIVFGLWILAMLRPARSQSSNSATEYS